MQLECSFDGALGSPSCADAEDAVAATPAMASRPVTSSTQKRRMRHLLERVWVAQRYCTGQAKRLARKKGTQTETG